MFSSARCLDMNFASDALLVWWGGFQSPALEAFVFGAERTRDSECFVLADLRSGTAGFPAVTLTWSPGQVVKLPINWGFLVCLRVWFYTRSLLAEKFALICANSPNCLPKGAVLPLSSSLPLCFCCVLRLWHLALPCFFHSPAPDRPVIRQCPFMYFGLFPSCVPQCSLRFSKISGELWFPRRSLWWNTFW